MAASLAVPGTWWRFSPRYVVPTRDRAHAFAVELGQALRAAHGLSVELEFVWTTGVDAGVFQRASGGREHVWTRSHFLPAYELGQWRPTPGPSFSDVPVRRSVAIREGPVGAPFLSGMEQVPWCHTVLAGLAGFRRGYRVRWRLSPSLRASSSSGPGPVKLADRELRNAPVTPTVRLLQDRAEARRWEPSWSVRGMIESRRASDPSEGFVHLGRLVSAAGQKEGGAGWSFSARTFRLLDRVPRLELTEPEVAGFFPAPWAPAPESVERRVLDATRFWAGKNLRGRPVGIPSEAGAGRHLLILGETGMGKSSLLVRLGWQAARRDTLLLFDPVGDTARDFLAGLAPGPRSRMTWISPAEAPISVNALADLGGDSASLQVRRERTLGDLVTALRRIRAGRYSESSYWGPRIEEMLALALRAASDWPMGTLVVAERLLGGEPVPLGHVPEPARASVAELRARVESRPEDGEGARRLLAEITRNRVLRNMLCAEDPVLRVRDLVGPGRVAVVCGDAPEVGEATARYLLAVHLALVWAELLARVGRTKAFILLDEAQWYAHESLVEMLRLGRRFNVHLWTATQGLRSLSEPVREALLTNAADVVLFRGAPEEAREFARWVPELSPEAILRLPRGQAALLTGKGEEVDWLQTRPLPAVATSADEGFPRPDQPRGTAHLALGSISAPGRIVPPHDTGGSAGPVEDQIALIWEALAVRLARHDRSTPLRLRLNELRDRLTGPRQLREVAVREAGRRLRQRGVLVRAFDNTEGRSWELDPDRLRILVGPGAPVPGSCEHDSGPDLKSADLSDVQHRGQ